MGCFQRYNGGGRINLTEKLTKGDLMEDLIDASTADVRFVMSVIGQHCSSFNILNVKSVKNSFLEAMYLLKTAEIKARFKRQPEDHTMIHVTSAANVMSIIRDNFDWRRVKRTKYGHGTSFTKDAEYGNRYANYNIGEFRAFIICKVLVSRHTRGQANQKMPPQGYDTTTANNLKVYVKFHDHEMLPIYVVYYTVARDQMYVNPNNTALQNINQNVFHNIDLSGQQHLNQNATEAYRNHVMSQSNIPNLPQTANRNSRNNSRSQTPNRKRNRPPRFSRGNSQRPRGQSNFRPNRVAQSQDYVIDIQNHNASRHSPRMIQAPGPDVAFVDRNESDSCSKWPLIIIIVVIIGLGILSKKLT